MHCNGHNSYLSGNEKEIYKFKVFTKSFNVRNQFCLGTISNKLVAIDSREVCLKGDRLDFSVDYNSIDKSNIKNIHRHLMAENNI